MLEMAGTIADGTLTWMTGVETIATHVTPDRRGRGRGGASHAARRVQPADLVAGDVADTMTKVNETLEIYGTLPSYRAMLDREGAEVPPTSVSSEPANRVLEKLHELAEAGATGFLGLVWPVGPMIETTCTRCWMPMDVIATPR